ncbi:hypothetical protein HETIRDRAFT_67962 [Heterobasidion irregulare TC 32-1]|uniref:Uncharacterized protein n=1 Tax=Heterobasidion irregulare (strain TC 32-1) TaxID=747525 RepID=W4JQ17_HETIT|nr:uncharacterized protein HETIRDRAFT_67962 [Heterobasidion irregulare TC 32-1]ETW74971.1 hypothetical protein HETIRDRAFT_67962 [Heterobasidion irregulare TC 32-1]
MASAAASENIASAANLTTPVAVFVGGTSGIGQGMAEAFNRHTKGDAHIVLVGRNRAAAETIISNMKSVAGESSTGSYEFVPCDVSLISNVKRSAADIVAKHPKVDFLLITAGVLAAARTLTAEGLDKASAVHYYGRWAFIHELLPALRAARRADADAKVISVFSAGRGYSAHDPATYNDLMCEEYALRNPGIVFAHAFPGGVRTNLLKTSDSALVRALDTILPLLRPFTVSQDECGEYLWRGLYRSVAAAGSGSVPGAYRIGSRGEDLGMARYLGTPEQRKALWAQSASLTHTVDP